MTISRCDNLSPLGIYIKSFTNNVRDTKYHKWCTLSKVDITLLDGMVIVHFFLGGGSCSKHTHTLQVVKTTLTCGSSIPALQLNTWIHIKHKLLQYEKQFYNQGVNMQSIFIGIFMCREEMRVWEKWTNHLSKKKNAHENIVCLVDTCTLQNIANKLFHHMVEVRGFRV